MMFAPSSQLVLSAAVNAAHTFGSFLSSAISDTQDVSAVPVNPLHAAASPTCLAAFDCAAVTQAVSPSAHFAAAASVICLAVSKAVTLAECELDTKFMAKTTTRTM